MSDDHTSGSGEAVDRPLESTPEVTSEPSEEGGAGTTAPRKRRRRGSRGVAPEIWQTRRDETRDPATLPQR